LKIIVLKRYRKAPGHRQVSGVGRQPGTAEPPVRNLTKGESLDTFWETKQKKGHRMASLRHVHQIMNERRPVVLADGRTGKIMRVDTWFPDNDTKVTVWTADGNGPGIAKVERVQLKDVVGIAGKAQ
jgi:hypothetical protein